MLCPRCEIQMDMFTRHGRRNDPPIAADMCLTCGGLWLDADEVTVAYPGLSVLEDRRQDALAAGDLGAGIPACPRCGSHAAEVPFFDLRLDLCTECHGVWIDGDEIEALSRALDRGDGLPVPDAVVAGGYRTAAAGVLATHLTTCVICRKQVPLRDARVRSRGTVCDTCEKELSAADAAPLPEEDEAEYTIPQSSALWSFVCNVGESLAILLSIPTRCGICGCRAASHCGHR